MLIPTSRQQQASHGMPLLHMPYLLLVLMAMMEPTEQTEAEQLSLSCINGQQFFLLLFLLAIQPTHGLTGHLLLQLL
jgi:hypothetical protein